MLGLAEESSDSYLQQVHNVLSLWLSTKTWRPVVVVGCHVMKQKSHCFSRHDISVPGLAARVALEHGMIFEPERSHLSSTLYRLF